VWWFVARSSGIIAWALLTLSVCWGLLLSTRLLSRRVSPAWLLDLHRHLGGLAVVFTGIHLVGLVADNYVTFGWTELFIPMASSWKPGAVAFGVVSFYLLLAIEFTSLAMRRLPRSLWRWVHRSSFVLFGFATYHGLVAGTDAGNAWYRIATWTSIGVVVTLTLVLVMMARRARTRLASLPPMVVRTLAADVPDNASSPPVIETLPAPVPVAPIPAPVAPAPVRRAPVPLAPAANAPAWSSAPTSLPASPFAEIAPLGSVEPFQPEVPPGPVAPPPPPRRPAAAPASLPAPVAEVPTSQPVAGWLPPTSSTTPTDDRELVTAGRVAADGGAPPTTAT
jgi:hypothetical protein